MTDITLHLAANFYPPIPHDIQLSVQEFFDNFIQEAGPYIVGWEDRPDGWEYEIDNHGALDMDWTLPNGRTITARGMLDELRLWDAIWWECDQPVDCYECQEGSAHA
jgi:hypothetical protein